MQHNVGSWYIPWNMGVPLQKILTVPFNPAGHISGGPGYPHHQPQIATAAVQHQQQPSSQQQCPSSPSPQQTYQQQLSTLQHHSPLHHQPMHPATAAMFTPLAIRSFMTHPHHGFHSLPQQQLTNVQAGSNNGGTNVNGSPHTSTLQHSSNNQQNVTQTLSPNIANHHHHSHAVALRHHAQHNNVLQASSLMTIPSMKKVKEL